MDIRSYMLLQEMNQKNMFRPTVSLFVLFVMLRLVKQKGLLFLFSALVCGQLFSTTVNEEADGEAP